ncbi:MAG: class II fumarate hydratase [Elusimicrobia bacterium]|jgi:fumarate hydratase class II|nr:class II fumarate hydratase [Elusimicrobiota bacterium]MBK7207107.1 class II fumarate hydratase [Elusimicrobiota bacterium]MBK7545913.1 class II fumarate hydratase [Elusimicrobiota bacterium]MBK7574789.1 class II fumarate hydratase [Elusimicrobiota bacterium]MBK7687559.1 class II fumarate hydratase [Elusimicrobiota bacterium]
MKTRLEKDSLGTKEVPADALFGIQTLRAVENFPVSGWRFSRSFIRALALIKKAAAQVNLERGGLEAKSGAAIVQAAREVAEGKWDDQFPVDIFQTGSGTSTNMNANEVIASRANEILGGARGAKSPVHPNDHVNKGQSSNDVIPSAIHVAALESLVKDVIPALEILGAALREKAAAFDAILKIGRTHLQDAVPMRLGQEFGGYASQIAHGVQRLKNVQPHLAELALGGTAVGTGLNANPAFIDGVIANLGAETGLPFVGAPSRFEALAARDACVEASGALKTVAVSLMKIANDIRWLSSGPRCGIGEIEIPSLQPGSSIMPGKVNPVIPEAVCMAAAQVIGADVAITIGGQSGNFELNVMKPMIAHNLLTSMTIVANVARLFAEKCVKGIKANKDIAEGFIEKSLAMCTALAPKLGYDKAAEIAKEAYATGKTVRQVALEKKLLNEKELATVLDARAMTEPGMTLEGAGG